MTRVFHPFALLLAFIPNTVAVVAWLNLPAALVSLALWLTFLTVVGLSRWIWTPAIAAIIGAAVTAGISMALYGRASGTEWWVFGPARVTDGSLEIAVATMARIAALAIPAVVIFRSIDLTAFADALEQTAKLPERLVWGSFAGLRQLELARSDWETVSRARRARGLASRNPFQRLGSAVMALFAVATERGAEIAVTLESRGLTLGTRQPSREVPWSTRDTVVVLIGLVIAVVVTVVASATGGSVA